MLRPSNIFILTLLLLASSRYAWGFEKVLIEKDVVYKELAGSNLHVTITRPENSLDEDLPLLLFMHGGSWYGGHHNQYVNSLSQFAETGDFVVASVEYRYSPLNNWSPSIGVWPDQINDCQDALDFLLMEENAARYGIDTSRVGTWGYSAGGHLSNLLAVQNPDTVDCEVNYSGPTDLEAFLESSNTNTSVKNAVKYLLVGNSVDPVPDGLAASASPITYLAPNSPPTLLVQTYGDTVVHREQLLAYHAAAQAMGADTTLWMGNGTNHGMACFNPARLETLDYFYDHLGGSPYQYKYDTSFEAADGYTASSAEITPSLIGQDGWARGNWGDNGFVSVRYPPADNIMDDTDQAIRLGINDGVPGSVSAYKQFTDTPLSEGAVEVWIDLNSHGLPEGMVAIGDTTMTFDEAVDSTLITDGIAAMFGTMSNEAVLYDGDELVHSGVSLANGTWHQMHAILYPETQQYALEVFINSANTLGTANNGNGDILVGFDGWVGPHDARDVGAVDLFSYRDTNATGLQNVGLKGTITGASNPLYVDNLSIYQNPDASTPVAKQWENKAHFSFEASEGYTSAAPPTGVTIIGKNGWTQGAWGTSTSATTCDLTEASTHATDGDAVLRVAGSKAAVYKAISDTPITDSRVDVWVDMTSFSGHTYFAIGDDRMVLGDDGSGNPLNDGIGAMFGLDANVFKVINGNTWISSGVSIDSGDWYQCHAILFPELGKYALEIFDADGNLVIGGSDWIDDYITTGMDLFSFRDSTVNSIQNIGVRASTGSGQPIYLDNITIQVPESQEEPIPGDANGDRKVDGSDVTILANNWQHGVTGTPDATWAMGDFNHDGKVDGSDVTILANNWQEGVSTTAAAVPEPSMFSILLIAIATVGGGLVARNLNQDFLVRCFRTGVLKTSFSRINTQQTKPK